MHQVNTMIKMLHSLQTYHNLNHKYTNFSNNLCTISKFLSPKRWNEASCILKTHKYYVPPYKI